MAPSNRAFGRIAPAVAVLLLPFLWFAAANAHATVVSAAPADGTRLTSAPASVSVTFDESVSLVYFHVVDARGSRVDTGTASLSGATISVTLRSGLGDGTYVESYRIVSADSHPVAGSIRFVVGNGALDAGGVDVSTTDTSTSAAGAVARWLGFAGIAVLGGAWLLLAGWPEGKSVRRVRRVLWTGWSAASAAAVAEVLLQGPYAAGESPAHLLDWSLLQQTLHSPYGLWHSIRLILLGVLGMWLARLLSEREKPAAEDAFYALGLGVLISYSATGHPRTTSPAWLSISVDVLHLAAMTTWVGGLAILIAGVLNRPEAERAAALASFGRLAPLAVATLAVTGTYSAWRGIGSWPAVFGTTYGVLLVGKVVLFAALLGLAWFARRSVQRRNTEAIRRAVVVEISAALVVFLLTAFLVDEPRGGDALAVAHRKPVTASAPVDAQHRLLITVDPGVHGLVGITVELPPGTPAQSLSGTALQPARQIGPLPITFTKVATGNFSASGVNLPVSGRWVLTLTITSSSSSSLVTDTSIHLY